MNDSETRTVGTRTVGTRTVGTRTDETRTDETRTVGTVIDPLHYHANGLEAVDVMEAFFSSDPHLAHTFK